MNSRQLIRLILRIVASVDVLVESIKKIAKEFEYEKRIDGWREHGQNDR